MQKDLFNDSEEVPEDLDLSGLFELSIDAFYSALYAQMSELPIGAELGRFVEKVLKAGGKDDRASADRAATDRGDPDVLAVLGAARKVSREIHRLIGLLRFTPDENGVYIARCAPDHFILPSFSEHFAMRFGETPWEIIDEKRGLCLRCNGKDRALLIPAGDSGAPIKKDNKDPWEELWQLYHRSVLIKDRKNPRLQQQLIPERYRKYLPEMQDST
ncbi:MAG: TIGR03915 family putative DNA repair protein [Treponema sp.]|nr:TIGR03915 family putative DNA repair protein [Treponema sp.]